MLVRKRRCSRFGAAVRSSLWSRVCYFKTCASWCRSRFGSECWRFCTTRTPEAAVASSSLAATYGGPESIRISRGQLTTPSKTGGILMRRLLAFGNTSHPWQRVHLDLAGPFLVHYWLLWVDSFTNYAGVHRIKRPDADTTIKHLRQVFAMFGLTKQLVSDNGPAFVGEEFQELIRNNGVRHHRFAPHHPQKNGEEERFAQTFKCSMKVAVKQNSNEELDRCLQQFLLKYRVTPHGTTDRSPAEMFLGRRAITLLDKLRPYLTDEIERRGEVLHRQRQEAGRAPDFRIGDMVFARFWYGIRHWRPGVIVAFAGPLSYDVQVGEEVHRRHAAQLLHRRLLVEPDVGEDREQEEALPEPVEQRLPFMQQSRPLPVTTAESEVPQQVVKGKGLKAESQPEKLDVLLASQRPTAPMPLPPLPPSTRATR